MANTSKSRKCHSISACCQWYGSSWRRAVKQTVLTQKDKFLGKGVTRIARTIRWLGFPTTIEEAMQQHA
eukprot:1610611-Amphidinium_carterae.1